MGRDREYRVFHGYQTVFADNMADYRTSVIGITGRSGKSGLCRVNNWVFIRLSGKRGFYRTNESGRCYNCRLSDVADNMWLFDPVRWEVMGKKNSNPLLTFCITNAIV